MIRGHANLPKVLDAFSGTQRHILDYLNNEVLRQQSESRQKFLLCTSILDPLNGSLCNAVMEITDGQDVLEELHKASVFVSSLDQHRQWYRYHALFAEALHYQLERIYPSLVRVLHSRASRWYAAQNQPSEAIHHALKAEDWDYAADLIDSAAWVLLSCKGKTLLNWLQQLLPKVVSTHVSASLTSVSSIVPVHSNKPYLGLKCLKRLSLLRR